MSMTLSSALLRSHLNPVFIESGTYQGGGVRLALEAGFREVHSIEIDAERFGACSDMFRKDSRVKLYLGDTLEILPRILRLVTERATIWLDAHALGANDPRPYPGERFPLRGELEILAQSTGRRDHTLLIDDRHDHGLFGIAEAALVEAVRCINPGYCLGFEDSTYLPKDILVANIPSKPNPVFSGWYAPQGPGSGPGSTVDYTEKYRRFIEAYIETRGIRSVVDLGCGDWQFSRLIDWKDVIYTGLEVVPEVVERLKVEHGTLQRSFCLVDQDDPYIPPADLVIVKDVLQHLPSRAILRLIPKLLQGRHALLINDRDPDSSVNNHDIGVGGYRRLDLSLPPFSLRGSEVFSFEGKWPKVVFDVEVPHG